jgi:hypothetical protein
VTAVFVATLKGKKIKENPCDGIAFQAKKS